LLNTFSHTESKHLTSLLSIPKYIRTPAIKNEPKLCYLSLPAMCIKQCMGFLVMTFSAVP
jgi:hypothetical protein